MNLRPSSIHKLFIGILAALSFLSSHSLFASEAVLAQRDSVSTTVQVVDYAAEGKKTARIAIDQFVAIFEAMLEGQNIQNLGGAFALFEEKMKTQKNLAADLLPNIMHNQKSTEALFSYELFYKAALDEMNAFAGSPALEKYREHDAYPLIEGLTKIIVMNMTIHYSSQLHLGSILRDSQKNQTK